MGNNETQSSSAPISAAQRLETYNAGMNAIDPKFASYEAPKTQTLTNGDYNALQDSIYQGSTVGLDRQKALDLKASDQAMSDRGIYTSLNAFRANNDVNERYAPQYAKAGADAVATRYGLQTQEQNAQNQLAMQNANLAYESKWRPADYKAGVWNGTGGVASSSTGGGWSI